MYCVPMPRVLGKSYWVVRFLMGEVSQYRII